MKFAWAGNREKKNTLICFELKTETNCDALKLSAVDFYQVYLDEKFVSYGPERTSAGYSRLREISLNGAKHIQIFVSAYNTDCYACDRQLPFFGAQVLSGDRVVYDTFDFDCKNYLNKLRKVPKYSSQRGFTEWYDYSVSDIENLTLYEVESPILLGGLGDTSKYVNYPLQKSSSGVFEDFDVISKEDFEILQRHRVSEDILLTDVDFLGAIQNKAYNAVDYKLPEEKTGFINLKINADNLVDIYVVFEEILVDGKWNFRRTSCNDYIVIKNVKGSVDFLSFEPYVVKHLKIITTREADIVPNIVGLENNLVEKPKLSGDKKIDCVINSAHNTFIQNAVDLFTDCPGRERAGWLCDSYFMGISEDFFTGKNSIEKNYLENIILSKTPELPQGMLPKCFPSEHYGGVYIPNWAMWFIVELESYFSRTKDFELINLAKEKVYGVIDFFKKYLNEYGLLENLESWIFIEWSVCNHPDYIRGVNFPSNMIYAYALTCAGKLYNDESLINQAKALKETIYKLSFNGEFFADNSVRVDGNLVRQDGHISETCQYYALFTGLCPSQAFKEKMITEFGPKRDELTFKEIGRSNVFIGYYLRYLWLLSVNEKKRILDESVDYFYNMASKTGTLWERDTPTASCNHGFASVIAYIYSKCL
ncbi:MAG: hypothetical protein IKJ14_07635 [Clostridia bacterium]|nr:hypothetical protein [Clostridia bacterium]